MRKGEGRGEREGGGRGREKGEGRRGCFSPSPFVEGRRDRPPALSVYQVSGKGNGRGWQSGRLPLPLQCYLFTLDNIARGGGILHLLKRRQGDRKPSHPPPLSPISPTVSPLSPPSQKHRLYFRKSIHSLRLIRKEKECIYFTPSDPLVQKPPQAELLPDIWKKYFYFLLKNY